MGASTFLEVVARKEDGQNNRQQSGQSTLEYVDLDNSPKEIPAHLKQHLKFVWGIAML